MSGGEVGPLFSPHLIEEAVLSQLMRRLPLYSQVAFEQWDVKLPEIVSWGLMDEDDARKPEEGLPQLAVVAEDTADVEEHADGWYRATWPFRVGFLVAHAELVQARKIAQIYGAVIQASLIQRRSLGLEGTGRLMWDGQKTPFVPGVGHSQALALNSFSVEIDQVVNWQAGPKTDDQLPQEPPGPDPEVTEIEVDVEVKDR